MPLFGTTARRVVLAILITALIPLGSAILIANAVITRVSAIAFQPEFGEHLDRALGVYAELARAIKQGMRAEARELAASERLRDAAARGDARALDEALKSALATHPSLAGLSIETCQGKILAEHTRAVDPTTERTLTVRRALGPADAASDADPCAAEDPGQSHVAVAIFATPRARFDELESAQAFVQAYHQLERDRREDYLDRTYQNTFAALLAATVALAVAAGVLVVRPVTRRIRQLAAATGHVSQGDLSVRVPIDGHDEVAELGRAFNHMLEELAQSRARVEFLRRMSEWQKVARRLAHEIKNPLTPIQLAVEECHRRYRGDDPEYRRILDTTHEIVSEEIGSLRRLVSEFSDFARLPRADLSPSDLGAFLREQRDHFHADTLANAADDERAFELELAFDIPDEPMPAALDREMLHRVLANILQNAAQALAARGEPSGRIHVSAVTEGDHHLLLVDDDGPGIASEIQGALFEPYVTTKRHGVGLGLSIVKKIIVDHGGSIDSGPSPLGGARFRIALPCAGTLASSAAKEAAPPPSSVR